MFLIWWEAPPTHVWCEVGDMEYKGWLTRSGNWVLSHVALWSKKREESFELIIVEEEIWNLTLFKELVDT